MLQVGQELWYVPNDRRNLNMSRVVRVENVGRKWAKLDGYMGQISIETLWLDGGQYSSPGRCWPSKEAWEAEIALNDAWADFQRRLSHLPPEGMSLEKLESLKRMIFSNH